jgi:elongation factor G
VDLVKNQAIVWHDEEGLATYDIVPIPEDMLEVKNTDRFLLKQ